MARRVRAAPPARASLQTLRSPTAEPWIAAGLTALAFGLRWACIHQSLYGDELYLYADVHGRSLGQILSVVHDTEKTPPLFFLLGWLFARGSNAAVFVRVPSLAASVATVPLIYLLGARTVGRRAAVVAAAWFAISPFGIFYGTEARGYSLVAALVVVSTLSLLAALESRERRWWVLYVLAAVAAVYTHYIAALTLVPQAAWAAWTHRETIREQLVAHALVILAYVPWLPSMVVQIRHSAVEAKNLSEQVPLTFSNVVEMTLKSIVGHPFATLRQIPGVASLAVLAALLAGLVVARAYDLRRRRGRFRPTLATRGGLIALLALAPLVGLVLYSTRPKTSFLLARNLSVAVPYALLSIGWLLTRWRLRVAVVLSVAALAAVAVGTVRTLSPTYQRTDARGAARYIEAHAPPGSLFVELIYPFNTAPAHPVSVYLDPRRHIYQVGDLNSAWIAGIRTRSPVFISSNDQGPFVFVGPPPQYASHYRSVGVHISRGLSGIVTREWAPR